MPARRPLAVQWGQLAVNLRMLLGRASEIACAAMRHLHDTKGYADTKRTIELVKLSLSITDTALELESAIRDVRSSPELHHPLEGGTAEDVARIAQEHRAFALKRIQAMVEHMRQIGLDDETRSKRISNGVRKMWRDVRALVVNGEASDMASAKALYDARVREGRRDELAVSGAPAEQAQDAGDASPAGGADADRGQ